MRIANWNVNSVRTRVDRIVAALARLDIDVLLVQETKCKDKQFPFDAFPGYEDRRRVGEGQRVYLG